MSHKSTSRRRFVQGATGAALAPFFIRTASADEGRKLSMGTVAPAVSVWADIFNRYKKTVKKTSSEQLKIKAFWGGSRGGELEMAQAVHAGRMDIFAGSMAALASVVPELEAYELPFLFSNAKEAKKALLGTKKQLAGLLEKRGLVLLLLAENGFRSMGFGPNGSAADPVDGLKGMKMRSMEAQCYVDMWKALGASPQPIPVTETLQALQTGVVDGYDNTSVFAFAAAWNVATSKFVYTEHAYQPGIVVMSKKVWNKLSKEEQQAMDPFRDEIAKVEDRGFRLVWAMGPQLRANWTQAGSKVEDLDPEARKKLAKKTQKVHGKFKSRTTKDGRALLQAVEKLI